MVPVPRLVLQCSVLAIVQSGRESSVIPPFDINGRQKIVLRNKSTMSCKRSGAIIELFSTPASRNWAYTCSRYSLFLVQCLALSNCTSRVPVSGRATAAAIKNMTSPDNLQFGPVDLTHLRSSRRIGERRQEAHHATLLAFAERARRIFELRLRDIPGAVFVGAELEPTQYGLSSASGRISCSGKGFDPTRAIVSCIGEGAEHISQYTRGDEGLRPGALVELATGLGRQSALALLDMAGVDAPLEARIQWARAKRFPDLSENLVPAALCYRGAQAAASARPRVKLSCGSASGARLADAVASGLLELIERDAVALWWVGGRPGAPLAPDDERDATAILSQLRGPNRTRLSWLLDLTTDIDVPCVAALSTNEDGFELAGGFAARPTMRDAAEAALLEMCQMELALAVVRLKRSQSGEASFAEIDHRHWRRATGLDANDISILKPMGEPRRASSNAAPAAYSLPQLVERVMAVGSQVWFVDQSRPDLRIPVAHVLADGLQPMPSSLRSPRLCATIEQTGGGPGVTTSFEIM
jgi:ribosomal protein S12 methylthiotransferase accessory factor